MAHPAMHKTPRHDARVVATCMNLKLPTFAELKNIRLHQPARDGLTKPSSKFQDILSEQAKICTTTCHMTREHGTTAFKTVKKIVRWPISP